MLVNPPFFYGPFAEGFTLPTHDYSALSTNTHIYEWLTPEGTFPPYPFYIDVRDIAKAHILALSSAPSSKVGRKRVIIASIHELDHAKIIEMIKEKRPELKDRVTKGTAPQFELKRLPFDTKRLEDVVGFKEADFTPLEDTIFAAIDSLLTLEKQWAADGYEIRVPA